MKKIIFLFFVFIFIILFSCNTANNFTKTSWVERLTQKVIIENEYCYAECSYVDKDAMIKNISSEGMNPFIYRDPIITKQESILFSLLIIPKINFEVYAQEVYIKTEVASYPILFSEYIIEQNMYESEVDSVTKKLKSQIVSLNLKKWKEKEKVKDR